jgi:hypothetical protein
MRRALPFAFLTLVIACSDESTAPTTDAAVADAAQSGDAAALADAADAAPELPETVVDSEPDAATVAEANPDVPAPPPDVAPEIGKEVSDTDKLIQCLLKNCGEQIGTCLSDTPCADAVGCLANCKGDTGCMAGCGQGLPTGAQQGLLAVGNCAIQQGCVQVIKNPNCGNGKCDLFEQLTCAQDCGTQSSVCGDGKCDLNEQLSCDADCKPTNPCGDGKCTGPLENPFVCPADCKPPKCGDGKCEPPWEGVLNCAADCTPTGACGNGNCDLPGESSATCPLDCGGVKCGDGACSAPYENPFTCGKDCPVPPCGDKKCEPPFETGITCALDCSPGGGKLVNPAGCIATKCGKESLACGGDFQGCLPATFCVNGCKDFNCVVACGQKLSGGSAQKFKALQDCLQKNCVVP